jgi:hypothetical protein
MTTDNNRASRIYNVVESVILGMSVLLTAWTAQRVINYGETLAGHAAQISTNTGRLTTLEDRGSRSLESHSRLDDQRDTQLTERINKLETAILQLQSIPTEIKSIGIQLDALTDGQRRMELRLAGNGSNGGTSGNGSKP